MKKQKTETEADGLYRGACILIRDDLDRYHQLICHLMGLDLTIDQLRLLNQDFCAVMELRYALLGRGRGLRHIEKQQKAILKDNRWLRLVAFWKKVHARQLAAENLKSDENVATVRRILQFPPAVKHTIH